MRAIVQDRYGPPDVLELRDVDEPAVGEGRVLVEVQAAAVNPLDWHIMRGKPFFVRLTSGMRRPKQPVRGVDVAGVVASVGSGVTRFRPGDPVFGFCGGALAEYVAGGESNFVATPPDITAVQAASVPIAGITALQGLRDLGKLQAGQEVLIIGASGGVGTFAVQIARSMGAVVTGVCSTRNLDLVRSIGAERVIDYTTEDLSGSYDVIFQLAGTASPARLRRLLTPKGTLVLSSGDGALSGIDRIVRALATSPFVGQRMVTWVAKENVDDLAVLAELLESGRMTPVIDRTYPLAEADEAIRYLEDGHTRGKVVVTIDRPAEPG